MLYYRGGEIGNGNDDNGGGVGGIMCRVVEERSWYQLYSPIHTWNLRKSL